jgi:hypothetical protein
MVLSSDPAEMVARQGFQQQMSSFTTTSFSGSYGLNAAQVGINQFNPLGACRR